MTGEDPFGPGSALAREMLASLAFRVRHACEGAPDGFAELRVTEGARTPLELLRHLNELLALVRRALGGEAEAPSRPSPPPASGPEGEWQRELARFERACRAVDAALAAGVAPHGRLDAGAILRGPLADALTHVGQLILLRRVANAPVEPVSYSRVSMPRASEG